MILVTGGAGYIGAHTNKALNQAGYETVVVDNLSKGYENFVKWGHFENYDFGAPISDLLSSKMTFAPPRAACFAAEEPAGPPPITNTSVSIIE